MWSQSIPPYTENLRRLQAWLFSNLPNSTEHTIAGWDSFRVMYCGPGREQSNGHSRVQGGSQCPDLRESAAITEPARLLVTGIVH